MNHTPIVSVVDDDQQVRESLGAFLGARGFLKETKRLEE